MFLFYLYNSVILLYGFWIGVIFLDIKAISIPKEHLQNVLKNILYNDLIGGYYRRFISENLPPISGLLENKLQRLSECNSYWELDVYKKALIKDFKKTNLCRDKFCNNCKKVKQAERMTRFMPFINKIGKEYYLSQMVLTVPNVKGSFLRDMIHIMFRAFKSLVHFLNGKRNIGFDFDIGFVGAIRSLEVTYSGDSYHPHFHVLLAHSVPLGDKTISNVYSYNRFNKRELRLFSDFEIMLQKVWYLLVNDFTNLYFEEQKEFKNRRQKITRSRLDKLQVGYSCMIDKFKDDDFLELFKYMTKGNGSEHKDENAIMSYDNFKVLYVALHGVRQIQGYGCFYNLKDCDSFVCEVNSLYDAFIDVLHQKEMPVSVWETVQAVLEDNSYTVISKSRIYSYVRHLEY